MSWFLGIFLSIYFAFLPSVFSSQIPLSFKGYKDILLMQEEMTNKNIQFDGRYCCNFYTGKWSFVGTLTYPDGRTCKGEYKNRGANKWGFVGKVVYSYSNGMRCIGEHKDRGDGTWGFVGQEMQYPENGPVLRGKFSREKDGTLKFDGDMKLLFSNGGSYTGKCGDHGNGRYGFIGDVVSECGGKIIEGIFCDRGDGTWGFVGHATLKYVDIDGGEYSSKGSYKSLGGIWEFVDSAVVPPDDDILLDASVESQGDGGQSYEDDLPISDIFINE